MISGLLDLVKYVYSSWLRVPSTSLSVNHKFHLSVIVPNGSITMVLVSNDSTVLEAKQAASLTVGLSLVGLQLYRPGRHWKRLPSSRTLYAWTASTESIKESIKEYQVIHSTNYFQPS
ncbi:hypothetical protein HDU99_002161 [Rhizoclosmatium hyalinum]|nr:hypothetical protein HDU99_002161 [Rhizoclosmatium hyalinum]